MPRQHAAALGNTDPFYGVNNQLRKASFYGGDGGNNGFIPQRRWW